jgi:hypothetical protein
MKMQWLLVGAFACLLALGTQAQAQPFTGCPGGTVFEVDDAGDAALIAPGYNNSACDLIITFSVVPAAATWTVDARSVTITGPGVEIINPLPNTGNINIDAVNGNVTITDATIRADNSVLIECLAPANCEVNIDSSIITSPIAPVFPLDGDMGRVTIVAQGEVNITNSTVIGDQFLTVRSNNASVTFICAGGVVGCQDPLLSGVSTTLCPGGFPCMVTFPDAAALRAVCFPFLDVQCGGAAGELHIQAQLDVNLAGSTITGTGTFRITSIEGQLLAAGANLTADNFTIGIGGMIDITGATFDTSSNLRMRAGVNGAVGCPAVNVPFDPNDACIKVRMANMAGDSNINIDALNAANGGRGLIDICAGALLDGGNDFPKLNGDAKLPYDDPAQPVLNGAAECAPDPAADIDGGSDA